MFYVFQAILFLCFRSPTHFKFKMSFSPLMRAKALTHFSLFSKLSTFNFVEKNLFILTMEIKVGIEMGASLSFPNL